jgi:hypothetical protein
VLWVVAALVLAVLLGLVVIVVVVLLEPQPLAATVSVTSRPAAKRGSPGIKEAYLDAHDTVAKPPPGEPAQSVTRGRYRRCLEPDGRTRARNNWKAG